MSNINSKQLIADEEIERDKERIVYTPTKEQLAKTNLEIYNLIHKINEEEFQLVNDPSYAAVVKGLRGAAYGPWRSNIIRKKITNESSISNYRAYWDVELTLENAIKVGGILVDKLRRVGFPKYTWARKLLLLYADTQEQLKPSYKGKSEDRIKALREWYEYSDEVSDTKLYNIVIMTSF